MPSETGGRFHGTSGITSGQLLFLVVGGGGVVEDIRVYGCNIQRKQKKRMVEMPRIEMFRLPETPLRPRPSFPCSWEGVRSGYWAELLLGQL